MSNSSIVVVNSQEEVPIDTSSMKSLIATCLDFKKVRYDEVTVHFIDKKAITKLHADFFDDPTPTDCISFPIDTDEEAFPRVLGEIFVCPQVAQEYTLLHGGSLAKELSLYVIHGLLHLLGYDDLCDADAEQMREQEKECLFHLEQQGIILA